MTVSYHAIDMSFVSNKTRNTALKSYSHALIVWKHLCDHTSRNNPRVVKHISI